MKKLTLITISFLMLVSLSACCISHNWQDATCTVPKTCSKCGETEGDAIGHVWVQATCATPKTCSVCGATDGTALGHVWSDASCEDPQKCSVCGEIGESAKGHIWIDATCKDPQKCSVCGEIGEPAKGHTWVNATCTVPKTCSTCGLMEGLAPGHAVDSWTTIAESTCTVNGTETGVCSVCGEHIERNLPLAEHKEGNWTVVEEATVYNAGIKAINCSVCGKQLRKEPYELTEKEIEAVYKSMSQSISYDKLARNPGDYEDEYVKFSGYVVQVCSEASSALYYSTYRVATSGKYNNVIMVYIDNYGKSRILEDDYITIYGRYSGLYTYESVMGSTITIPSVKVEYYK